MDLDEYLGRYAHDCKIKRVGKRSYGFDGLKRNMAQKWRTLDRITITTHSKDTVIHGDSIVLTATQTYRHWGQSGWEDHGVKTLVWEKRGGEWKIAEESFYQKWGNRR